MGAISHPKEEPFVEEEPQMLAETDKDPAEMLKEALERNEKSTYGLLHTNAFKSSHYAVPESIQVYMRE